MTARSTMLSSTARTCGGSGIVDMPAIEKATTDAEMAPPFLYRGAYCVLLRELGRGRPPNRILHPHEEEKNKPTKQAQGRR